MGIGIIILSAILFGILIGCGIIIFILLSKLIFKIKEF